MSLKLDRIEVQCRKNENVSISSDSVYDSVAYDLVKTKVVGVGSRVKRTN